MHPGELSHPSCARDVAAGWLGRACLASWNHPVTIRDMTFVFHS